MQLTPQRNVAALGLTKAVKIQDQLGTCTYDPQCSTPNAIVITLPSIETLDAVVWRGCSFCTVELSVDGATWTDWLQHEQQG